MVKTKKTVKKAEDFHYIALNSNETIIYFYSTLVKLF